MVGRALTTLLVSASFALATLAPAVALATSACWPFTSPTPVVLGFGARYSGTEGSSRTHGGVDLAAPAGAEVVAPAAGTVSFAGRVPAGEGATTLAVSILMGDGRTVTLLPLEAVSVQKGAQVSSGSTVGTLAAGGDASSPDTHLHVGLKTASMYLDPESFLVAPMPVETSPESPAPDVPAPATSVQGAPVASAPAAVPVVEQVVVPEVSSTVDTAGAPSTAMRIGSIPRSERVASPNTVVVGARGYAGDVRFLEGLEDLLRAKAPSAWQVGATVAAATVLVGSVVVMRDVATRGKREDGPTEARPVDESVAAAAGRW